MDKLVRNDLEALKRKSLNLCSGETSNDPALVSFLSTIDLTFHQFDNDVVVNYSGYKVRI